MNKTTAFKVMIPMFTLLEEKETERFKLTHMIVSKEDVQRMKLRDSIHEEEEYKGLKIGTPKKLSHIITQHHAIPGDPFANYMKERKLTYKDDRVVLDHSKGYEEKEFPHPKHSSDDWMNEVRHLRDRIKNNPPTNSEIAQNLNILTKRAIDIVDIQKNDRNLIIGLPKVISQLQEQIESHLKLIQEYREENIKFRKDLVKRNKTLQRKPMRTFSSYNQFVKYLREEK